MLVLSKRRNVIYLTLAVTIVSCIFSLDLVLIYKNLIVKTAFVKTDLILAILVPVSIIPVITYFLLEQIYLLSRSKRRAEELIFFDELTKVYNRRYFECYANNVFAEEKSTSMILIDIDDFKKINDEYGHQAGDYVMKEMAKSIQSDLRDTDKVARIGGDEFAIICKNSDSECMNEIAERIRSKIENTCFAYASYKIFITVSIGCISSDISSDTFEELHRKVDLALYESKDNGKNIVTSIHCA